MELTHTHRTHQIRTDYELAALTLMGMWEKKSVDQMEQDYRGAPNFEKFLKECAGWLERFRPGFTANAHECHGQLC